MFFLKEITVRKSHITKVTPNCTRKPFQYHEVLKAELSVCWGCKGEYCNVLAVKLNLKLTLSLSGEVININ